MAYVIKTNYAMKAKVQTIVGGKVINHRGFVDAETWIPGKIDFLMKIYKFDDYELTRNGDVFTLRAWRKAGKPGTRGKAMNVTHVITLVD